MTTNTSNALESLEGRRLMSTTFEFGTLEVRGTDGADQITLNETFRLTPTSSGIWRTDRFIRVTETTAQGTRVTEVPRNDVRYVYIEGRGGNDTITNNTSLGAFIHGGGGGDTITGGGARDYIYGDAVFVNEIGYVDFDPGADLIQGGGGDDYVEGNAGDDSLYGGAGGDTIVGNAGVDRMYGETGNDSIFAKDGNGFETVDGGEGTDSATTDDFLKPITSGPLAGASIRIRDSVFSVEAITT